MKRTMAVLMIMGTAIAGCQTKKAPENAAENCPAAKIKMAMLTTVLRDRVLAKPENADLKTRFEAAETQQRARAAEMIKDYAVAKKNGKIEVDLNRMKDPAVADAQALRDAVDGLVRKEATAIVAEQFKDRYKVVFDEGYRDNVVYSNCIVPDLTSDVQEYLVRQNQASK